MFNWINITTNAAGVPYFRTTGVTVGTDTVDLTLGFRRIPAIGYFTVNIATAIPEGTTTTLPVRITLNGNSRNITSFGGSNVTVADLQGTGIITLFYDWYTGTLQIVSPFAPTA
jgi:hypothetical protein